MQLIDGELRLDRSDRRLADELASTRPGAATGEWNLTHPLFGETPNRATGTVALPCSDGTFSARSSHRHVVRVRVAAGSDVIMGVDQKPEQVGHVLETHTLLQPFGHQ